MWLDYFTPLVVSLVFIAVVYLSKYIARRLHIQNEDTFVIAGVSLLTFVAMVVTYLTSCGSQSFTQCFYLGIDLMAIVRVLVGNTILFSTHILTMSHNIFEKPFNLKALVIGPIVEEILFRTIYLSISHEQPNIYYLSFIFSIAHAHHLVNAILSKQQYNIKMAVSQLIFTFVFGLYCFYILKLTRSTWSVILLHSYCNYLGPPMINNHPRYHLASIIAFVVYTYFAYY